MNKLKRILRHLFSTRRQLKRSFPAKTRHAIEREIKASESAHVGQIRFAIESALSGTPLYLDQSSRERAIDLFAHLRMWDTDERNGVLVYVLLADRSVDIVADRGVYARTGAPEWERICHDMEVAFRHGQFEAGAVGGIRAITHVLMQHFPSHGERKNELPDKVIVL